MFRNQYDTDVTTWSPAGRLHQVEYAMEAVKQGSVAVGLRSDNHVVLAAIKRAASELSSYQRKVFKIDDHMGIAIAGLNADGRVLSRYMRSECMNHKFVYESPLPVGRLVTQVADKSQVCTHRSWKRPYGVGMLVAGHDATGPHLFETCPSGNYWEYHAMAIGSRSQASKTYLERKFQGLKDCSLEELVRHALNAVKESLQEGELSGKNCSVAVVGQDTKFKILSDEEIQAYIDGMEVEAQAGGDEEGQDPPAAEGDAGADQGGASAEVTAAGGDAQREEPQPSTAGSGEEAGGESNDGAAPMET